MQEQRKLPALRAHFDKLLDNGWVIAHRDPLTLRLGHRTCLVMHGMLISEGALWNQPGELLPRAGAAALEPPLAAVAG